MYSKFAIYEFIYDTGVSALMLNPVYKGKKKKKKNCNLPLRGFLLTVLIHFVDEFL